MKAFCVIGYHGGERRSDIAWQEFIIETLRRALAYGTPLLLGTLGEIYSERAGVLNLGVEGMMIL